MGLLTELELLEPPDDPELLDELGFGELELPPPQNPDPDDELPDDDPLE